MAAILYQFFISHNPPMKVYGQTSVRMSFSLIHFIRVETIRLLQKKDNIRCIKIFVDSYRYIQLKYSFLDVNNMRSVAVVFLQISFIFCNVISRPNQNSKKIPRPISRVVGHPRAMKIRTFCAKVLNLLMVGSRRRAAHGPR